MDNINILRLFEPETETHYELKLNNEDYERALQDVGFAQSLLFHAEVNKHTSTSNLANTCVEQNTNEKPLNFENDSSSEMAHDFWSHEETLLLINLYGEHQQDFSKAKKRKQVWTVIAERMASYGHNKAVDKIERKWLNLMQVYRRIKDNNSVKKTGKGAMLYKYFEHIDEIIGDKPTNKGTSTIVLSVGADSAPVSPAIEEGATDDNASENSEPCTTPASSRKRKSVVPLNEQYLNMKQEHLKTKEAARQKRHEDILELENKKLQVEEKKIAVLEKLLTCFNK